MSEKQPYQPARQLERPPRTIGEQRQMAASAQRALNDPGFVVFLDEMQEDAADSALFAENPEVRNENRLTVLMIAQLRGRLRLAAAYQEEEREETARAQSFE
jgi:hypothetical protein